MSADDTLAAADDDTAPRPAERREAISRGEVVGRYVVLAEIGAGGMGVVYAAYDPELDRKVAIKLLHPHGRDPAAARLRLQREGKAMAKLSHPNVAGVHDVGTIDGRVWLAMEFVAGQTLTKWLAAERRSWRDVVGMFVQIGRGLAAAHAEGLLHRDIKPDNVMIEASGRARILDFGLARTEEDAPVAPHRLQESLVMELGRRAAMPAVTRPGAVVGTPSYMAPEQFDRRAVDARADQFAFCIALWEGLYGERPFVGDSLAELMTNILEGNRRPTPRSVRVPGWLRRVMHRGLAVDRELRWPSMQALLDALDRGRVRARFARGVVAVGVVGLCVGGTLVAQHLDEHRRIVACDEAGAEIDDIWNHARRAALRAGLLATAAGHAATTADKVVPWLDDYAARWKRARTESCLDADVRNVWDADTLARATWCLDDRRMELDALAARLAEADVEAATRAVQAAASLRPVEPCRDIAALARLPPLPGEIHDEVKAIRADLSRVAVLEQTGAFEDGLELATTSLDRAVHIAWPPLVAAARLQKGALLQHSGQYADAEATYEAAYFEAVHAGATEEAWRAAEDLAFTVGYRLARHAEGERWSRHAEGWREVLPDPLRLREAVSRNNLAVLREAMGTYDDAAKLHARALEIREKALGPDHPDVAVSLNNLANVRRSIGAYDEATALHERALGIREKALGPEHPDVARTLNNLASVHYTNGNFEEAAKLYSRSLDVRKRALGPEHPDVAQSLNNLASVYIATQAYGEAAALHEQAIRIREKALGSDHPNLASSLTNLANVRYKMGEYRAARGLYERALAMFEGTLGPVHPWVAHPLAGLAYVSLAEHRAAEALSLAERAVAIRSLGGASAAELAEVRYLVAQALVESGGARERAFALAEQARHGYREAGPAHLEAIAEIDAWLRKYAGAP